MTFLPNNVNNNEICFAENVWKEMVVKALQKYIFFLIDYFNLMAITLITRVKTEREISNGLYWMADAWSWLVNICS